MKRLLIRPSLHTKDEISISLTDSKLLMECCDREEQLGSAVTERVSE